MLPALERSTLILSRLSGIARFHEGDDHIGFTNIEITRLVEILSALSLICHRILLIVIEELDLYRMFSSWLRITIDRVSTSNMSDEIMEKEALLDAAKVLRYIEKYLVQSPMSTYFDELPAELVDDVFRKYMQDSVGIFDQVDKLAHAQITDKVGANVLPQMSFLVDLLAEKAGDIFHQIAEAEKRSVRFGQAEKLDLPHSLSKVDMTMCSVHRAVSRKHTSFYRVTPLTSSTERGRQHHIHRHAVRGEATYSWHLRNQARDHQWHQQRPRNDVR